MYSRQSFESEPEMGHVTHVYELKHVHKVSVMDDTEESDKNVHENHEYQEDEENHEEVQENWTGQENKDQEDEKGQKEQEYQVGWVGQVASRRVEEGLSRSFSGGGGKPSFPSPSAGDKFLFLKDILDGYSITWSKMFIHDSI